MKHIYVIDTKLMFYNLKHRRQSLWDIYTEIANTLHRLPQGDLYFATDIGKSDFRLNEQSYYKGTRRKNMTPAEQKEHEKFSEAYLQFIELSKFLNAYVLDIAGLEADDQASILAKYFANNRAVTLVTADRDWAQIVLDNPSTRILLPKEKTFLYKKDIIEEYGTETKRDFCMLKAISGDAGDNIVLIKGVGKERGRSIFNGLLEKYENPTDKQVIKELEEHLEENPKRFVHELHVKDGRKTVKAAYYNNMLVAETFTSVDQLTKKQAKKFKEVLMSDITYDADKFYDATIETLGFPLFFSTNESRLFL